jgi:hypothetical protein
MTLTERITEDLKAVMKSGDAVRLTTIRSIRAALIDLSKRGTGSAITPEEEVTALLAAAKKRKEAIEMYEQGGRADLVALEQRELAIITEYLPKQMTREEAESIVARIIAETGAAGAKDFPKVMPQAMKELKGKIDGKAVQEIVRQRLGE